MTHTPGPWKWDSDGNLVTAEGEWRPCEYGCFGWTEDNDIHRGTPKKPGHEHWWSAGRVLSGVWCNDGTGMIGFDGEDAAADEALIAAAPDLLAALEEMVDPDRDYAGGSVVHNTLERHDRARAAIAKARGTLNKDIRDGEAGS